MSNIFELHRVDINELPDGEPENVTEKIDEMFLREREDDGTIVIVQRPRLVKSNPDAPDLDSDQRA